MKRGSDRVWTLLRKVACVGVVMGSLGLMTVPTKAEDASPSTGWAWSAMIPVYSGSTQAPFVALGHCKPGPRPGESTYLFEITNLSVHALSFRYVFLTKPRGFETIAPRTIFSLSNLPAKYEVKPTVYAHQPCPDEIGGPQASTMSVLLDNVRVVGTTVDLVSGVFDRINAVANAQTQAGTNALARYDAAMLGTSAELLRRWGDVPPTWRARVPFAIINRTNPGFYVYAGCGSEGAGRPYRWQFFILNASAQPMTFDYAPYFTNLATIPGDLADAHRATTEPGHYVTFWSESTLGCPGVRDGAHAGDDFVVAIDNVQRGGETVAAGTFDRLKNDYDERLESRISRSSGSDFPTVESPPMPNEVPVEGFNSEGYLVPMVPR